MTVMRVGGRGKAGKEKGGWGMNRGFRPHSYPIGVFIGAWMAAPDHTARAKCGWGLIKRRMEGQGRYRTPSEPLCPPRSRIRRIPTVHRGGARSRIRCIPTVHRGGARSRIRQVSAVRKGHREMWSRGWGRAHVWIQGRRGRDGGCASGCDCAM